MSLFAINKVLNDALRPDHPRFSPIIQQDTKLEKIAASAFADPHRHNAEIGKMITSGALRRTSNDNLQKRGNPFPIKYDDPDRVRQNRAFAVEYQKLSGHAGLPSMSDWMEKGGRTTTKPGDTVRNLKKAADDQMLPLQYRPSDLLSDQATATLLQIEKELPNLAMWKRVMSIVMGGRQNANPNDFYRWKQSISQIAQEISSMCAAIGLDPSALLEELTPERWYDPMVASGPSRFSPAAASISPNVENPSSFFDVQPPDTPTAVDPEFGSDSTVRNPDFRQQKLAKFYDGLKRGDTSGVVETASDRRMLEKYAEVILQTEFDHDSGLRGLIEQLHKTRSRVSAAEWGKVQRQPHYESIVKAIINFAGLTPAMKGACLALVGDK
jgi:hypothetical protein